MPVGQIGIALLVFACVLLPYASWRTARAHGSGALGMSRYSMFVQVITLQTAIFALSWFAAHENGVTLFVAPPNPMRAWIAAAVVLAVMVTALKLRWKSREPEQKLRLYSMLPRTRSEFALFVVVCLAAGVAEEAAYRGVVPALLTRITGSFPAAILVSAVAFALAHALQGWRAVASIFLIALGAQALVFDAKSLIPVMTMHAAYDVIAGILVPRWYERDLANAERSGGAVSTGP